MSTSTINFLSSVKAKTQELLELGDTTGAVVRMIDLLNSEHDTVDIAALASLARLSGGLRTRQQVETFLVEQVH